jgi:hypothetical protein
MYRKTDGDMIEMWKRKWYQLVKIIGRRLMRIRDFQQILGKFTNNEKGTIISDCPIYIETMDGHLEAVRRVELQETKLINSPEPKRIVLKTESLKIFKSPTYKQS